MSVANYDRVNWEDAPSTQTPLNAENLNNMDAGIEAIDEAVENVAARVSSFDDRMDLLDARMDTLVAIPPGSTTENSELLDIRVGANGNTYSSAGAAVRGQINDVKGSFQTEVADLKADLAHAVTERIALTKNGYYNLGSSITYIDPNGTPSLWNSGICVILPCVPGDVFNITSKGTAAARNWAFLSNASSNNIISRKTDGTNQYICDNEMVTAPENSAYIVLNANKNETVAIYKGKTLDQKITDTNDRITTLGTPIATNSTAATNVQSNDNFDNYTAPGNYKVTTFAIAQTVTNIPVILAGRLIVLTTTSNSSPLQIYIANNASCYIRIKVGSAWRAWKYLTDEATDFVLNTLFTNIIADNTDIDTIRTPGNYKVTNIASANTMSNLPETQGGRLTVLTLGVTGGIHQWYISQSNNWYVRELISGNWSAWKKFTDETYVNQTVENSSENLTATKSAYNMFKILANQADYNIGFANAFVPITLKSYLGNNQNVHPKVLYFENGFGGHKYWMGYTPYPYSNDNVENPCVAYSDDGIDFTNINGNPLDNPGGNGYDSDIHLVYRSDTGTLEAWFRYVGDESLQVREETIYRRTTTDGVTWTAKEKLYSNETGVISKLLSPSIEWNGVNYCIWVVRDGVAIDYYEAPGANPTSWTLVRSITLSFVDDGLTVKPWHMDVIKDGSQYIMLIMCRNGTGITNNKCSLFISTSSDNINYSTPVKVVGGADSWDRYMYRSSIVKVGDKYRIYYSAGSGGTTTLYDGAVWGIGITESDSLNDFIGLYY